MKNAKNINQIDIANSVGMSPQMISDLQSVDVKEDVAFLCSILFEFFLLFFGFSWIEVYCFNRSPVSRCSRPAAR